MGTLYFGPPSTLYIFSRYVVRQKNLHMIQYMTGSTGPALKGAGGVPLVQIMENEFECLVVRGGDGGHFAEKFVKKYCS